ncbi:MAG TPA: hypothetical protein VGF30_10215 [Bacteroidia bacterium]
MEERDAIIYLNNGQRKCGKVLGTTWSGEVNFISNAYEILPGIGSTQPIECIAGEEILEIDFCLK